jgi:hypothetical protein
VIDTALPAHERELATRLRDGLAAVPGVRLLQQFADAPDRVGVVAFEVADLPAGLVAAALSAEHGIGVRDGRFCPPRIPATSTRSRWAGTTPRPGATAGCPEPGTEAQDASAGTGAGSTPRFSRSVVPS